MTIRLSWMYGSTNRCRDASFEEVSLYTSTSTAAPRPQRLAPAAPPQTQPQPYRQPPQSPPPKPKTTHHRYTNRIPHPLSSSPLPHTSSPGNTSTGLLERYETIVAGLGYEYIDEHMLRMCSGEWGRPIVEELRV